MTATTARSLSFISALATRTSPLASPRRTHAPAPTTPSFDEAVLVVDSDDARALSLVVSFRLLGANVATARTLDDASRLLSGCSIVALDDDAFGATGVAFLSSIARTHADVFRCAAARWSRFSDVRGVAQYVFAKPFSGAVVADALSAARARHATSVHSDRAVAIGR